ncbi:MAG: efflux RND transporter permease subunit [Chlamydiales bacterium]|nr:efflux RND transporter permease subunit [Chlamydiales bacterium]
MNLSAPFIRRPVMTVLIMITILIFGLFAYKSLPVSDLPNIEYPTIQVSASQPGGSPEYMANLVATPLERNLAKISGLNTMTSSNKNGKTSIVMNFDLSVSLDAKEVEVQAAITETLPSLPPMPYNPTFNRNNPSDAPIIFLLLTSPTASLAEMYEYGHDVLSQPISMINGVSEVHIYGIPYAVRVQVDPMKMMAHNVDFNEVKESLIHANPNIPGGKLRGLYYNYIIESFGQLTTGEGYGGVIIKEEGGTPLYLSDISDAKSALAQRYPYYRYETKDTSQNMVILAISRLADSNTIDIAEAVFNTLPKLQAGIPKSISLINFFDKADAIMASIEDVKWTLIIALALVVLVIFLYLGKFFDALIPSIVLPMAMIATFIIMYFCGFNVDILSLLALTLSIGFVVDDAIVVLENIVRYLEMGETPYNAAMKGSKQISITVLSMTLALSAVFIPFIWMRGMLGRIFNEFSVTIVAAILCSGFISLTLNPMLCSRFMKKRKDKKRRTLSQRFNQKLVSLYMYFLHHSIRFKKTTVAIGIACIVCTFLMLKVLPLDFIPNSNMSIVSGLINTQQGGSKQSGIRHLNAVSDVLRHDPLQDGFMVAGGYPNDDQGVIYCRLPPPDKRPTATEVSREMMGSLSKVVGVQAFFRPFPLINLAIGGGGSLGSYQYILYSVDKEALYEGTEKLVAAMQKMPDITGVNSNLRMQNPQLNITYDRDRAGMYGITIKEIESTLQSAFGGGRISTFSKGVDLYDLILEVAPGYDLTADDLDLLYIKSHRTHEMVPLSALASWKPVVGPSSVNHYNTFNAVIVSFSLAKGGSLGPALDQIQRYVEKELPDSVIGQIEGAGKIFRETFSSLKWLILLAIFVIYVILGILYESFIHPITILSALPVATLGGLLTLWIFQEPLSLFSAVGLIVLIGIVQKNGIMLIDFALEYLQEPGETPTNAIIEACKVRFRPIIMTTLAAMLGALPVAIGIGDNGDANRPLGLVVFGGLLFSQLITLFVTPVVFLYMQEMRDSFKRQKAQKD